MQLPSASTDFASRCEALLASAGPAELIYSALELRLGIEARLGEYVQYAKGLSRSHRKEWEITKLAKTIDGAYELGDTLVLLLVHTIDGGTVQFLYAPVSQRLQEIGKKCGDYLHARRLRIGGLTSDLSELRALVSEGLPLLKLACSGEIVRPSANDGLHFVLRAGDPRSAVVSAMQRGEHKGATLLTITPTGPIHHVSA